MEGNALLEIRLLVHYCKCFRLKKGCYVICFHVCNSYDMCVTIFKLLNT